jgi:predicted transcriptional regulator YdeE
MDAKIQTKPGFTVLGLARRGDANAGPQWIPPTWDELFSQYGEQLEAIARTGAHYGMMNHYDPETHTFEYLACFETEPGTRPPEGLTTRDIPEQEYAVIGCTIKTIGAAYTFFNQEWLPASGYERAPGAEFELYDEAFQGGDNDPIYMYFPIQEQGSS